MKILLSGSTILLLIFLASLEGGLSSCTKDKTIYDTVTVIQRDTIIIKDTALTAEILTAHPWKMQEMYAVTGGLIRYYLKGASGNTESFDNEYIVFNMDKSGTYVENGGRHDAITWDFANAEKTKIYWTLHNTPATFVITWDNIRYKNSSLFYDEYYTDGNTGENSHAQEIRVPL
ncbi:MAG: hypothetical protein JWM28_3208 [Chitinophagaceae bacterium]|nr:hypothetical protein [Chitinophagaceae bacterium]